MKDTEIAEATCRMIRQVADDLARDVPDEWQEALAAVPRHRFLPDTIWSTTGEPYRVIQRDREPTAWLALAYSDEPVATQLNDGATPDDVESAWVSSSASQPSIVVRMLIELDAKPGHTILEVGTGTGWNAGLLAHRYGSQQVTSIELDPSLAEQATRCLQAVGLAPTVVTGDGERGWNNAAPYDRVLATCSVRRVPAPWIEQSRVNGVILTPWDSAWCNFGLLRLVVASDGIATGRFEPHGAFMPMRSHRVDLRIFRDVVRDEQQPSESVTALDPADIAGDDFDAQFAFGLRLNDVWHAWHDDPDVPGVESRLWLATIDRESWAAVDLPGVDGQYPVWQFGPRRLWDEAEQAWSWYEHNNRPSPSRFGLTVKSDGTHVVWLDAPEAAWWELPSSDALSSS